MHYVARAALGPLVVGFSDDSEEPKGQWTGGGDYSDAGVHAVDWWLLDRVITRATLADWAGTGLHVASYLYSAPLCHGPTYPPRRLSFLPMSDAPQEPVPTHPIAPRLKDGPKTPHVGPHIAAYRSVLPSLSRRVRAQ